MTISYNWLCSYLPISLTPNEISTILTSVGLEVESMEPYETIKGNLRGILIGKVLQCEKHPNADKLKITTVTVGAENNLQIVCGAPNVAVGQTVVVATVGSTLFPTNGNSFEIKKAKIRGVESMGMLCAEDEIGIGTSHDGIIVIDQEVEPGTEASVYYNLPATDTIFEIGLTPNRMDAMSHMGCVKDILAYCSNRDTKKYITNIPDSTYPTSTIKNEIEIEIENTNLCKRYAGITITNIEVKESPEWLQSKLKTIGLRPINNIVDITNYVMHECGQPLHAFDAKKIVGKKIIVKTIPHGTKFTTLDDKEREIHAEDAMICNATEPMCIAGVFGGAANGVTNATTSIFLESAFFDAQSIRKTSLRHGLRTDASIRFEKGADSSNVPFAIHRATHLILAECPSAIASICTDIYPTPLVANTITVPYVKVNELAGKNYCPQQVKNILTSLCFDITKETEQSIEVKVPFAKPDVSILADVVEEIMRIDGLDNIPFTGYIKYSVPTQSKKHEINYKNQVAQTFVGKGFYEIFTNSITNASYYKEQEQIVKMQNSLSANLDCMRMSMLETGLEIIAYNTNRKNNDLKFFEFGKTYRTEKNNFIEEEKLCFYITGSYNPEQWHEKQKPIDIYYVKGLVESIFSKIQLQINEQLQILVAKKIVGTICSVEKTKLDIFSIKQEVFFIEIDWTLLKEIATITTIHFTSIPKFPAVRRDLALILDKNIKYTQVQKAIQKANSSILQSTNIFDVFENEKLGATKKSYAINFTFSNNEKTLTDTEIEEEMNKIIISLQTQVQAEIRNN